MGWQLVPTIPTTIRRIESAIPGRLYLYRACLRLTNQCHCYKFTHYCQDSFRYDAFLIALRVSLAEASLASRWASIVSARPWSLSAGVIYPIALCKRVLL